MKRLLLLFALLATLATTVAEDYTLRATKYHPGMGGAGWVTASGARIDNKKLKRYEIRWVALSHDMFRECGFRMGDTIEVECERIEALNGLWIVKDKMGRRLKRRIDFLLPKGDNYRFTSPTTVTIRKATGAAAKAKAAQQAAGDDARDEIYE